MNQEKRKAGKEDGGFPFASGFLVFKFTFLFSCVPDSTALIFISLGEIGDWIVVRPPYFVWRQELECLKHSTAFKRARHRQSRRCWAPMGAHRMLEVSRPECFKHSSY